MNVEEYFTTVPCILLYFQESLVIHEGNTKEIITMTVTLYLIKLIDIRKILYKILMNIRFYIKFHPKYGIDNHVCTVGYRFLRIRRLRKPKWRSI